MGLPPPESSNDKLLQIEARLVAIEVALASLMRNAPNDGRTQSLFALFVMVRASASKPSGTPGLQDLVAAAAERLGTMALGPDWKKHLPPPPKPPGNPG